MLADSMRLSGNRSLIDLKLIAGVLGAFLFFMGLMFLFPLIISLIYKDGIWYSFLISAAIACTTGGACWFLFKPKHELRTREGFFIVSASWFMLALVGALPFTVSEVLGSYTDAVFETMSGLTTTGATILGGEHTPDIEDLPKSLLFWRSLAHWLGGMGIIVLSLAILPLLGVGGMQLFQAESPGPTADKLTPRVQETAKLLWVVYVAFTFGEFILLWLHPSMDWFEALNHAFATLATGGFSTKNASVAAFDSVYIDLVITLFMFLAGINFALHFKLFKRDYKTVYESRELRLYTLVTAIAIVVISLALYVSEEYDFFNSIRYGAFQAISIITTTGFGTSDYENWIPIAYFFLFALFFTGGMAGSTGGGIKMVRLLVLFKSMITEFKRIVHPRAIIPLRLGNFVVDKNIQQTIFAFLLLYLFVFGLGALCIAACGYDIPSSLGASIACLGNVGPGYGAFGPTDNFAHLPLFGKWVCIFLMVIGRLEVFTVLILVSPEFWKK